MTSQATNPLRITFVLPYAGLAGGIRVLAIYAQLLQRRGHQVTVISTPWFPPGRKARAIDAMRRWFQVITSGSEDVQPSHFRGLDIDHVQLRKPRPVRDGDVPDADVVVATWWETAPWVAALSDSKGAKAYFVQDYGAHGGQPMEAVAATWHLPLHKIVISRWLMSLIEEHCSDRTADYVPNAVDLERFNAPPRGKQARPTVGFQFNPAPQKGCDTIAKAVEIARKNVPDLHVIAFGPGSGDEMRLPKGTEYYKYAPDEQLPKIYASCDAWLFASRREGFGLPILEAMACRTPVIATPAGAAPELVGEGGGTLVRMDDPADMAAAIVNTMHMPDASWRALSDAAFATASRHTWEDATTMFENSLRRAIARSCSGGLTAA